MNNEIEVGTNINIKVYVQKCCNGILEAFPDLTVKLLYSDGTLVEPTAKNPYVFSKQFANTGSTASLQLIGVPAGFSTISINGKDVTIDKCGVTDLMFVPQNDNPADPWPDDVELGIILKQDDDIILVKTNTIRSCR